MIELRKISPNFNVVDIDGLSIWFSYRTPIAFSKGNQMFVCRNVWGTTTGRHLNQICMSRETRIGVEEFESRLTNALSSLP